MGFWGSERQPSRCLTIQEGSRDVAHLPDTMRGAWNVTDTGRTRGLKGFQSCNRDTMVRVAEVIPLETMELPRSLGQPGVQQCATQGPCPWGP